MDRARIAKMLCSAVGVGLATGIWSASSANAQVASEAMSLFGDLQQGSASFTNTSASFLGGLKPSSVDVGPNACVPTAVLNGLTELEGYYGNSVFQTDPNQQSQISVMAGYMNTWNTTNTAADPKWKNIGGTQLPAGANGLVTYLANNTAPLVTVSVQTGGAPAGFSVVSPINNAQGTYVAAANAAPTTTPTAAYLANCLQAHDGVELGLQWGNYNSGNNTFNASGGGHFVTLQAINMTGGTGTMTILDPWGDVTSNTPGTALSQSFYNLNVSTTTGGQLYITYAGAVPTGWAGLDGFTPDGITGDPLEALGDNTTPQTALVVADFVEAVPEPTTICLLALGAGALSLGRKRRMVRI